MPFPSASPYRCWPAERGRRWPALPTGWLGRSRRNSFSPSCINPAGAITGYYCDATNCHGFLRTPGGTITSFDIPGDANGTYPSGLTPAGASEGNYIDASGVNHGFFGVPGGTLSRSMFRARALAPATAPFLKATTRQAGSRETTLTGAM